MKKYFKLFIYVFLFSILLVSYIYYFSYQKKTYVESNACVGSFDDYAYGLSTKSKILAQTTNYYVNENWIVESDIPVALQSDGNDKIISGQLLSLNGKNLLIKSGQGTTLGNIYDDDSLYIYNLDTKEWKNLKIEVDNCNCVVNELFVIGKNIFASNTGPFNEKSSGKVPVLSKYNSDLNTFEPLNITSNIFSGSKAEIYLQITRSNIIYDEIGSIWIFSQNGDVYKYNTIDDKLVMFNLVKGMAITKVVYNPEEQMFYLYRKNSYQQNFLGLYTDYDILKIPTEFDQINIMGKLPFYWSAPTYLWVDKSGDLWFDVFGYIDTNSNQKKILPNIFQYIFYINHYVDIRFVPPMIIEETSNGILWFRDDYGIAWYNKKSSNGCWDSISAIDVFEDDEEVLWMINNNSLFYRE